jgi:hypothetical protein
MSETLQWLIVSIAALASATWLLRGLLFRKRKTAAGESPAEPAPSACGACRGCAIGRNQG